MYKIYSILFIVSIARGSYAQFEIGDVCTTSYGNHGVCRYEQTCKYAMDLRPDESLELCGYEDSELVVCCPQNNQENLVRNTREMGVQTTNEAVQPPEPEGCPSLPRIRIPSLDNPAHTVAWEKCVANQRYVHVCKQDGQSYTRHNTCAIPTTTAFVSGKETAAPKEFPHMAVLGNLNDENKHIWVAAGSLISDKFILTVGHILENHYGTVQYALLGTLNTSNISGGELYVISRLIPHKFHISSTALYDIGLVELGRRVIFSEFIRPICLPVPGIEPEDSVRLVAGWGLSSGPEKPTDVMHKIIVSEVSRSTCKKNDVRKIWSEDKMICTQGLIDRYGHAEGCQVDGGAPLMYKVTDNDFSCNYVLAGLASWGGSCFKSASPTVYTKVSANVDWIVENVWPEELINKIHHT